MVLDNNDQEANNKSNNDSSSSGIDFVNDPDVETETDGPVDLGDDQKKEQEESTSESSGIDFVNDPDVETETDGPVDFSTGSSSSGGSSGSSSGGSSSSSSSSTSTVESDEIRNLEEEKAEEAISQEIKEAEQAEEQITQQLTNVKAAEENQKFNVDKKTAKQIRQNQGPDAVQDQTVQADNLETFLTDQKQEIDTQQNELQDFQTVIEEEEVEKFDTENGEFLIEFAGEPEEVTQEPEFADTQDLEEAEGFGRRRDIAGEIMIAEGLEGLQERQEEISERERTTVSEIFGAGFAVTEEALSREGGVFQAVTDEERRQNIDERKDEFTEDARVLQSSIERPDKTGLLVFGGTTRAVGSLTGLTPEDREIDVRESSQEFAAQQAEFAREDPARFGAQTLSDFGVAAAATGTARGSTRALRSARSGNIDFSKGQSRVDPFSPARDRGPKTQTRERVRDRVEEGEIVEPDPELQAFKQENLRADNQPRIDSMTNSNFVDQRTVTPDIPETDVLVTGGARNKGIGRTETGTDTAAIDIGQSFGITRPEAVTRSRSDNQADVLSGVRSRNRARTLTRSRSTSDAITRARTDVDRVFARPRPRARRGGRRGRRRRRIPPFGGFSGSSDSSEDEEIQGVFAAPKADFQPSIDAVITGQTGEVDTDQELTGFETRPIPESNSNGNNNNDLDLFT